MTSETNDDKPGTKGHKLLRDAVTLSPAAVDLLNRWRIGDNYSQPSASFGPFTYSEHANIFIDNAIRLCEDDGMSDFRVYGAVYCLRHGIELMLKCWSRNQHIDAILRSIMRPHTNFGTACEEIWPESKERKKKRPILLHALCAIRNRLQDGLSFPDLHKTNIDDVHADLALSYLRAHPNTDRFYFCPMWPVATSGHSLPDLWQEASPVMEEFADQAKRHASEAGYDGPISSQELQAIVDLLGAMDDGGNGLRYPSSITGAWYSDPPKLSLEAVRNTAESVKYTCKAFEDAREEAYSLSTFGSPSPK